MSGPVLLAVDDDPGVVRDVERELLDRYARQYSVMCVRSAEEAVASLEGLAADGEDVALVLAGQWLTGMTGVELLSKVHHLHPHAKRGLLIPWGGWGERATGQAIHEGMAHGRMDYYVLRPSGSRDEVFHQTISSLLLEWARVHGTAPHTIHVVGESWSGRAYELRDVLGRCAIPHSFCLADSPRGRDLIAEAGVGPSFPVVLFPDGEVLVDPSDAEIAVAAGAAVDPKRSEFDLVIVGAGPAGLSAAVYGASEGFSTLVVDAGGIGGQASSSALIRNYLGFPRGLSGGRLAEQAYEQAWVFGARFAFMQRATDFWREGDRLVVSLSEGGRLRARAVVLATGAAYRRLGVPALEELNGAGVFYGGPASEAPAMAGEDVYVLGGANAAGQAALHLARYARRVTLVVRAGSLAAGMSHYLARQVEATPNVEVCPDTEIVGGGGDGWLEQLVLRGCAGQGERTVAADGLFVMIGASPNTGWFPPEVARDTLGFVRTGAGVLDHGSWTLEREPFPLETSMPGAFAAGDVRQGSVKRVASAVGEGSAVVQHLHSFFGDDVTGAPLAPVSAEPDPSGLPGASRAP
jgi:thioredoxin reductase (NADPH)